MPVPHAVALVGTGLIGGSIGMALRRAGSTVRGWDADGHRLTAALEAGALDEASTSLDAAVAGADLAVVAVPVGAVADVVVACLDAGAAVVTDVGSVKAPVLAAVDAARPERAARFVGGHPMAGSEQSGIDGADPALLLGATWVLTPTEGTDPTALARVQSLVATIGAEVLVTRPERHDDLVAIVSHVPQLAATTLMDLAAGAGEQHATLLRLAAGGFRDMTRIAAGDTEIWPDICVANREAIVAAFDRYMTALDEVRDLVATANRDELITVLERARDARRNLPVGLLDGAPLAELRVPIPDRRGIVAEVTTLVGDLGVNIADLEIAHSAEGGGGVLMLVIAARSVDEVEAALAEHGYSSAATELP